MFPLHFYLDNGSADLDAFTEKALKHIFWYIYYKLKTCNGKGVGLNHVSVSLGMVETRSMMQLHAILHPQEIKSIKFVVRNGDKDRYVKLVPKVIKYFALNHATCRELVWR